MLRPPPPTWGTRASSAKHPGIPTASTRLGLGELVNQPGRGRTELTTEDGSSAARGFPTGLCHSQA